MPGPDASDTPTPGGLDVAAFRGVRFAPGVVAGDLGDVTAPPYDVLDAAGVQRLESADLHNVVRLVLPRGVRAPEPGEAASPDSYERAAATLRSWVARGTLRVDEQPACYVYEQRDGDGVVRSRGMLVAVGVGTPGASALLPHEDVMPGPVEDRLALLRATRANLEPLLLAYDGGGAASDLTDAATTGPPLLRAHTDDGMEHRIWAVRGQAAAAVRSDLRARRALVADGHHRYAACRALLAEERAAGVAHGPAERALALLVDQTHHPLDLGAIHRVLTLSDPAGAAAQSARAFTIEDVGSDPSLAYRRLLDADRSRSPILLGAAGRYSLLLDPDPRTCPLFLPPERSARWCRLGASLADCVLVEGIWAARAPSVSYVHDTSYALAAAGEAGRLAVLLAPVPVTEVQSFAARGEMMPRKSTSFGPKPRSGLVLRLFTPPASRTP